MANGTSFQLGPSVVAHAQKLAYFLCLLHARYRKKPEIIAQITRTYFEELGRALVKMGEDRLVAARVLRASITGIFESIDKSQGFRPDKPRMKFARIKPKELERPIRVHARVLARLYIREKKEYMQQLSSSGMSEAAIKSRFDAYFWQVQMEILRLGGDTSLIADFAIASLGVVMDRMERDLHGESSDEVVEPAIRPPVLEGLGPDELGE